MANFNANVNAFAYKSPFWSYGDYVMKRVIVYGDIAMQLHSFGTRKFTPTDLSQITGK